MSNMQDVIHHRIMLFLIFLLTGQRASSLKFSSLDGTLTKCCIGCSHRRYYDYYFAHKVTTAGTWLNQAEDENEGEDTFTIPSRKDIDLEYSSYSSTVKQEYVNENGNDANLSEKKEDNSDKSNKKIHYLKKQRDEGITGIGGKGGIVYDVNKVKRNLVQETVRAYKGQLLDLLATPPSVVAAAAMEIHSRDSSVDGKFGEEGDSYTREFDTTVTDFLSLWPGVTLEDFIEAKIKALVDVNPVTTTTDSNLLEGLWELAYWVDNATAVLDNTVLSSFSSRNMIRKPTTTKKNVALLSKNNDNKQIKREQQRQQKSGRNTSRRISNIFTSSTRQFYLENLEDTEDAYVIDKDISLDDGLFAIQRRYDISKLTRTSLDLTLRTCQAKVLFGALSIPLPTKRKSMREESRISQPSQNVLLHIRILYLDSDLCICLVNDNNKLNTEGSLAVYTKSEKWIGTKERVRRKVSCHFVFTSSIL
jgi:hypothetical protein